MKKIIIITLSLVVVGAVGIYFATREDEDATVVTQQSERTEQPASGCGVKGFACSAEEIAKHNKSSDCWVIYKGNYYDVTSYVSRHEGGSAVFNDQTCGQDIQKYLEGEASSAGRTKSHPQRAYQDLEKLLVGPVAAN